MSWATLVGKGLTIGITGRPSIAETSSSSRAAGAAPVRTVGPGSVFLRRGRAQVVRGEIVMIRPPRSSSTAATLCDRKRARGRGGGGEVLAVAGRRPSRPSDGASPRVAGHQALVRESWSKNSRRRHEIKLAITRCPTSAPGFFGSTGGSQRARRNEEREERSIGPCRANGLLRTR